VVVAAVAGQRWLRLGPKHAGEVVGTDCEDGSVVDGDTDGDAEGDWLVSGWIGQGSSWMALIAFMSARSMAISEAGRT